MFPTKSMLANAIAISAGMFLISCTTQPQSDEPVNTNDKKNTISLAGSNESGQRLTINGKVVDSLTNQPISDAKVYFYHADANGEYLPGNPHDEWTAKLSGEIVTGDNGQFTLHTILPGEYHMPGNKHIHIHYARAEGYKEIGKVILFENNVNDEVRSWANETGFGIIIELYEYNENLIGYLTIHLLPMTK